MAYKPAYNFWGTLPCINGELTNRQLMVNSCQPMLITASHEELQVASSSWLVLSMIRRHCWLTTACYSPLKWQLMKIISH